MSKYTGVIIEESLKQTDVLEKVRILSTKVETVTKEHSTPHLKQWTLHSIEVEENNAEQVANELSKSIRGGAIHDTWYADYKNETTHFIIFPNKVFKVDRRSKEEYDKAKEYGISLGIPPHQVDFHPEVIQWQR